MPAAESSSSRRGSIPSNEVGETRLSGRWRILHSVDNTTTIASECISRHGAQPQSRISGWTTAAPSRAASILLFTSLTRLSYAGSVTKPELTCDLVVALDYGQFSLRGSRFRDADYMDLLENTYFATV